MNKPLLYKALPDLAAFILGLSMAWFYSWQTRDLVWSLWLGSLVTGYITILAGIAYLFLAGIKLSNLPEEDNAGQKTKIRGIGLGAALFMLVFFSVHFCGFHAGHAGFLQSFFPIEDIPNGEFTRHFANPIGLWQLVITELIPVYGIFILPIIVAERHNLFKKPQLYRHVTSGVDEYKATKAKEKNSTEVETLNENSTAHPDIEAAGELGSLKQQRHAKYRKFKKRIGKRKQRSSHSNRASMMAAPYKNVVRMHLLIFVFAITNYFSLDNFALYAIVYAAYFFPWALLSEQVEQERTDPGEIAKG